MAMAMDQDKDDIVRRVIRLLASQPNNVIEFADLHANFKSLMEERQFELFLRNYADQLELFEDGPLFVRLAIKVKVCKMHCSNQTCPGNISVCKGLHICKRYILYGNCIHNPCIVGHDLTTSHNMEVLSQLLLDQLPVPLVEDLLKRPNKRKPTQKREIYNRAEICESYNKNGGCRKDKAGKPCPYLHLCKNNITRECMTENCQRSHFIHESTVRNVLEKHGISMGRIPKENLAVFRKIMQANDGNYSGRAGPIPEPMFERNAATEICESYNKNGGCRKDKAGKPCPYLHLCKDYIIRECKRKNCQRSHFIHESMVRNVLEKHDISMGRIPKENLAVFRTIMQANDGNYSGRDGPIPEPMFERVRQATSDMVSETAANNILNKKICIYHLKSRCAYFERCFNYHCELLYQWFYRFDDSANWETVEPQENMRMELHYSDPAKSYVGATEVQDHESRGWRQATDIPSGVNRDVGNFGFAPPCNKLAVDADGYRSTISSQDLEQAYISNPDGQLKFSTQGHEYVLDFANMVQRNLVFKTEREVSRRPKFVSKDELESRKKQPIIQKPARSATSGFVPVAPQHWNLRPTDELLNHCKLVPLDERNPSMNTEYNKIKSINDTVEAIYRQGFDFRLSGTASGTAYGKGSYFATTAKYSNCYTDRQKETMGMFIAKVLVGDYTKGDKSYTRPPQKDPHDLSSPLYDSCVDSVTDPKIFVIFELGQVYPEYLIKYKSDFSP
ncbi:PAR12-like protein [Mya arenaria]|uniref:PAR12-like protein n=1 Tax=Mya arenaria TaxID=6604 RepID=A0ABY7EY24_MYAAR|nr:PAR12-like protein [Mya arenaria]